MTKRSIVAVGAGLATVIALPATTAYAAGQIGSAGIKDNSLQSVDYKDGSVKELDTSSWIQRRVHEVDDLRGEVDTLKNVAYLQTDKAIVTNSADASRDVRMQLALRVNDGSEWGQDFGTCFTGELSPLANREATCHTTRMVEVTEASDLLIYAFGYEDDQGSGASGQVDAQAYVTATQIR